MAQHGTLGAVYFVTVCSAPLGFAPLAYVLLLLGV